ncbi:thioester domain-containing protein [Nocardiopsis ganjiahuensis]|uniref:thioester domain-containing protein n=1 Tax=Nocardiopsis ganjiahuensis TaxID=239984 RepID=UPI00034D8EF9|nr:thioester domain-containing protein [Nocardiopsis ganjiahuensis]
MTHLSLRNPPGHVALAAAASALLALGLAAPAAAEPAPYQGSVRGQYTGVAEHGHSVTMRGEPFTTTATFNVHLDDSDQTLTTYCIDFRTGLVEDSRYREDQWENYPGQGDFAEPGKVHWILKNSYPVVDVADLEEEAEMARLTESEALTATQAAIWHFSNELDLERVDQSPELDDNVNAGNVTHLYNHLVDNAEDLPNEPGSALTVSPGQDAGLAGETIGEFTVETSAESIPVRLEAPDGVELVDAGSGEALDEVESGDTVAFSVPADADAGEAALVLETTAAVETGRLFKGEDTDNPTQTLITVQDSEIVVSEVATVAWDAAGGTPPVVEPTEEPSPSPVADEAAMPDRSGLALTGNAVAALVVAAVVAIAGGGTALFLARRRRAAAAD